MLGGGGGGGGDTGRGGGQVSSHSGLSPLSPVFVPASAGGGGQGDATTTDTRTSAGALGQPRAGPTGGQGDATNKDTRVSNRTSAGALGPSRAGPTGGQGDATNKDTRVSNRTSATAGGLTFSVGSTVSDGTSTRDDLLLVAALRRSEATAAYQAMADQAITYGDLVRALLAAQARVAQVPLSPAGPGVSGVRRRKLRSRQQRFLKEDVCPCKRRLAACHRLGRLLETRFHQRELETEDTEAAAAEQVAAEAAREEDRPRGAYELFGPSCRAP